MRKRLRQDERKEKKGTVPTWEEKKKGKKKKGTVPIWGQLLKLPYPFFGTVSLFFKLKLVAAPKLFYIVDV